MNPPPCQRQTGQRDKVSVCDYWIDDRYKIGLWRGFEIHIELGTMNALTILNTGQDKRDASWAVRGCIHGYLHCAIAGPLL